MNAPIDKLNESAIHMKYSTRGKEESVTDDNFINITEQRVEI